MLAKRVYRPSLFNALSWAARDFDHFNRTYAVSGNSATWKIENDVLSVTAALPGVSADDINVAINGNNILTISGETAAVEAGEDAKWLRRERRSGSFSYSLKLPWRVEDSDISADYTNGILTVSLPRAEAEKPRQIAVNAA